ncbi:N-acetylmuramoyl-L-alanine amidase-like domain-containing protein [Xylanibacter muris]|uniref:DUF1460 domain-containing protein n=1 Tax=Xylanibacter muris TaxID=2736290 RepID=A0ABX2AL39_9BACT|nr:N-acetylmuramoyl-L-alanine amidase-like domain-containing protein [Xylanibacter muris]NPD91307.1 DUF1460 domain-containing protein [Xylanibacter muris]
MSSIIQLLTTLFLFNVAADASRPVQGKIPVERATVYRHGGSSAAECTPIYSREDSIRVMELLAYAASLPDSVSVPVSVARRLTGVPYVASVLERGVTARGLKERMVVNLRELDCTTLVETVTAVTLCRRAGVKSFEGYVGMLEKLRYRDGCNSGYVSRLHYFTDWIKDNGKMGFVRETNCSGIPFNSVQTISLNYMTTHPQSYRALRENASLVPLIRKTEKALNGLQFRYIPKNMVAHSSVRKFVRDGDIIAITCRKAGLDIAHVGFAVWHEDGLHLLNASSIHHKVVEEPMTLSEYLKKHPSHTGIRVVRIL